MPLGLRLGGDANWLGAGIHYQHLELAGYPPLGETRPVLRIGEILLTLNWLAVMISDISWIEPGGATGTFTAWSHLLLFSVGLPWGKRGALGATLKVYHDRILGGTSFGVGLDVGLLWETEVAGQTLPLGLTTTDWAPLGSSGTGPRGNL